MSFTVTQSDDVRCRQDCANCFTMKVAQRHRTSVLGSGVQHAILSNVDESFDWKLLPETRDAQEQKIDDID